jgi:hypothetical protein
LYILVNATPLWLAAPFTEVGVNAGQSYAENISTNAVDPEGQTLTFSKILGPAWLSVAANGAITGTPANSDAGLNTFIVRATDPGGAFANTTMYITVNGPPAWVQNPFSEPGATAGQPYSATVSTNATDPNGDILTFAKVSGPTWLTVGTDGTLSGTPQSSDIGPNSFSVSATDPGGLSASATLNISVNATPIIVSASLQGGALLLSWTGGNAPYQVQSSPTLDSPNWQPLGGPINTNTITVSPSNAASFYRVFGQ